MNRREFLGKVGLAVGAVVAAPLLKIVPDVGNAGQAFLLDAVTRGTGRMSPMVLDNLGRAVGKTWYVDSFAGCSTNDGDAPDNAFATLEDAIMATSREMGNAARKSLEIRILGGDTDHYADLKERLLQDPETKAEYDALEPWYQRQRSIIRGADE